MGDAIQRNRSSENDRLDHEKAGYAATILLVTAVLVGCSPSLGDGTGNHVTETVTEATGTQENNLVPQAVVAETVFDFGFVEPAQECAHEFLIRNEGDSVLRLHGGRTTCKCTVSEFPKAGISPGEAAKVRVTSKVENKAGPFQHSASIQTNDPKNEVVDLTVKGEIRTSLGTQPRRLICHAVREGKETTVEVTLYSQTFAKFEVLQVEPSREGFRWQINPAGEQTLKSLGATSGYQVRITLPKDLHGDFWESLKFTVMPEDQSEPQSYDLRITGKVPGRITVHGNCLHGMGKTVMLGSLQQGQGKKVKLLLHVRDEHRDIEVESIESRPDFLLVDVEPLDEQSRGKGLYQISIEVPTDAPPCNFMGGKVGELVIKTNHPEVPDLMFKIHLAISASDHPPY